MTRMRAACAVCVASCALLSCSGSSEPRPIREDDAARRDADPVARDGGLPDGSASDARASDAGPPPLPEFPRADPPPPPLAGGTLLVTADDRFAVAADPDRDRIWVVDMDEPRLVGAIELDRGEEPGRAAEDAAGRVHVLLRRGGAVLTLDPETATTIARRPICVAPRGIAFAPDAGVLHVACLHGELRTIDPATGAVVRDRILPADLRDVAVDRIDGTLYVSRWRAAEVLVLDVDGAVVETLRPTSLRIGEATFVPAIAARMTAGPESGVVVV